MNAIFQPYATRAYRRDIQGIRAIGAIMIMIYHVWVNKVSGGVDVFFVVSGFFMGNVLLAQLASDNTIRPFIFWGRIINRVAPSAYLVLVATLILAYFFVPETQWMSLVDEILASAFHLENIHLMRSSVDYLARQEPPSAVQQFWALSIQMQFYFMLPFVLWIAAKVATWKKAVYPLMIVVLGVILVSFVYSLYATQQSPDSAYFNPFARVWEFFVGVAIAVLLPYLRLSAKTRVVSGYIGLLTLLFGGLVIPRSVQFPGYIALVPVSAAALLIVSGTEQASRGVSRLLAHRVFGLIGQISFTIYLWHWPLMVFYLEFTGAEKVGLAAGLMIIIGSVALAIATSVLVEKTFLQAKEKGQNPLKPYVIGTLFLLPAVAVAGAVKWHFVQVTDPQQAAERSFFQESQISIQQDASSVSYTQFLAAKSDKPASYRDDCHQHTANPAVDVCEYGATESPNVVALAGGSHATQWLPALDTIGRALNLKVINISKSYCPLGALPNSHPSCVEWNERVVNYLIELQPQVVITNSTRAAKGDKQEYLPESYVKQWLRLGDEQIEIIGIRDNPQFDFDAVHCVVRNKESPLKCAKPRLQALQPQDPAISAAQPLDFVQLIDMTPYFCTGGLCPTVFDDILMYRDREHISVSYVDYLTARLYAELAQVLPAVFPADSAARVSAMGAD